jgi:hypothetical protein
MKLKAKTKFPPGWDEERARRVLEHYENQSEDEAAAEDEASFVASAERVSGKCVYRRSATFARA